MKKSVLIGLLVAAVVIVGGFVGYREYFGVQAVEVDSSEQGQKIAAYANPDAFITPKQLKGLMEKNEDVVIIGALNPKNGDSPISGSHTMWRGDYSAQEGEYPFGGMRGSVELMEGILSGYGATPESTIVVYASNSHHDAARLWWQIKSLGHEDVRYLDGGLNAWIGAGYPTGDAPAEKAASAYKAPGYTDAMLAELEDVIAALDDENVVLIDTRTEEEEQGTSTKSGAFGPGKIAGAVFIPWTDANNEDTTLKSRDELAAIYGEFEGKTLIPYCQSGVRSAHTMLVLTQVLGYENVMNYDGSWIEYSYEVYEQGSEVARIENGE